MELKTISEISEWRKMKKLYKSAFPRYERKPMFIIWQTYKKGRSDIRIIEENGEFSGMAITLNTGKLVLLDYFAISDDKRGKGLGSNALKELQRLYSGRKLFLEIESTYTNSDNAEERKKRKQFYLNNGMSEMKIMVNLFGTDMEVLGYDCTLSFEEYYSVYSDNYGRLAAKNIIQLPFPEKI